MYTGQINIHDSCIYFGGGGLGKEALLTSSSAHKVL